MSVDHGQEESLGRVYDTRLMLRLLTYLRPYPGQMTGSVVLIILSSLLQLVGPLATAVAIDLYIRPGGDGAQIADVSRQVYRWLVAHGIEVTPAEGLFGAALVYLLSQVLSFVVLTLQSYVMQMMGQRIMRDLRGEVFGHLQRLPVAFFDRHPVGRLVTRVSTDVDALNELFTAGLVSIFGDVVLLAGIVGLLFWLDWRLAVVSFSILPLLLLLTLWFKARARQSYRDVRVWIARISAFLQEHLTGMSVVQLFGQERQTFDQFDQINRSYRDANVRAISYYAVYYPAVELITALGTAAILWYGGGQVVRSAVSLGALMAFLQYAQRFYQPIADLSDKVNILQAAMASSERIFQLLDEPNPITSPSNGFVAPAVKGRIEFDRVQFAYQPGEPTLRDLSFVVEPGEMVALVGHTGAGKSTIANLLLRFYEVTGGAVRVDGIDVREWDLTGLRRNFAMVLQDVFLFSGTIAGNLRLGNRDLDLDQLRWATDEVGATEFIETLPNGFDSAVLERGAGLSVGQKQLLAFARALAFDPRILVLDEATSAVDTETEQRIQQALARLLVGRTSLVIAHRLSTIQRADRILVLHKGELREQGNHQELLARRGIYYRLSLLQYGQPALLGAEAS